MYKVNISKKDYQLAVKLRRELKNISRRGLKDPETNYQPYNIWDSIRQTQLRDSYGKPIKTIHEIKKNYSLERIINGKTKLTKEDALYLINERSIIRRDKYGKREYEYFENEFGETMRVPKTIKLNSHNVKKYAELYAMNDWNIQIDALHKQSSIKFNEVVPDISRERYKFDVNAKLQVRELVDTFNEELIKKGTTDSHERAVAIRMTFYGY